MKTRFCLSWVAIMLGMMAGSAFAAEEPPRNPGGLEISIGFSGFHDGYGSTFVLASPRLFGYGNRFRNEIRLFADLTGQWMNNAYAPAGTYVARDNTFLNFGLQNNTYGSPDSIVVPYTRLGASYGIVNSDLYSSTSNWGMYISFGVNLIYLRNADGPFGESTSSFFIEGDIYLLHGRADLLAGSPDLINALYPTLGFRSHF